MIKEMLVDALLDMGKEQEVYNLLLNTKWSASEKERERLLMLADLSEKRGNWSDAVNYLLQMLDIDSRDENNLQVFRRAFSLAAENNDPALMAKAVSKSVNLISQAELFRFQFEIAVLYFSNGMTDEAEVALKRGLSSADIDFDLLVRYAMEYPAFAFLVNSAIEKALESEKFALADELMTVRIFNAESDMKIAFLKERASLRKVSLGNMQGAVDDLLEVWKSGGLSFVELEQLQKLLLDGPDIETARDITLDILQKEEAKPGHVLKVVARAKELEKTDVALMLLREAVKVLFSVDIALQLIALLNADDNTYELEQLINFVLSGGDIHEPESLKMVLNINLKIAEKNGDVSKIISAMERYVKAFYNDKECWQSFKDLLEEQKEWNRLRDNIISRLNLNIDKTEKIELGIFLAGLLKDKLKDSVLAAKVLEQVLSLDGKNKSVLMMLGDIYFSLKDWQGLKRCLLVLKKGHWHSTVVFWQAALADAEGNAENSLVYYRQLALKVPRMKGVAEGFLKYAAPDSNRGDAELIVELSRICFKDKPPGDISSDIREKVAKAHLMLGNNREAIKYYKYAVSVSSDDVSALEALAYIYKSEEAFEQRAEILCRLGYLVSGRKRFLYFVEAAKIFFEKVKDYKRAHYWFSCAAETEPDNPEVLIGMADCGWHDKRYHIVTRNMERLRVVAPHLSLDASRRYHFAKALVETSEWPNADILELLERIYGNLTGMEKEDAAKLIEFLKSKVSRRF
jgi:tetratricopeptide (TPR) repeat protein